MARPKATAESNHFKSLHALCPHCSTPGRIYGSRQITPTYKQFHLACRNPLCGHSWLAELNVVHTIVQSACPHPDVSIKLGPTLAQMIRANSEGAGITGPPANDDEAPRRQG